MYLVTGIALVVQGSYCSSALLIIAIPKECEYMDHSTAKVLNIIFKFEILNELVFKIYTKN